jgi:phosphoribosylglycinamide formyltransferase-1
MKNIAILASGSGTNAENVFKFFAKGAQVEVKLILSNNPKAGVLDRAKRLGIPWLVFNRETFYKTDEIVKKLLEIETDLIVLAGFLWLVPGNILKSFPDQIINIHPALLPKYGGKGMYGHYVHEAVIASGDKTSGITIHYVNEKYDEGQIIFQKELQVFKDDTPESLASRIHQLEYEYFPKVIESLLAN